MNPDDVRTEGPEGTDRAHTGPGGRPGGEGPEHGAGPFRGEGDPAGASPAPPEAAPDAGAIPDAATTEAVFADLAKADPDITAALRRQWGADAAKNLAFARAAVDAFAGRDLVDFLEGVELDGQPLAHHPAIWETAARIGRMLARDPGKPGSVRVAPSQPRGPGTNGEKEKIEERIDDLMALMHSDKAKYQSERVQRELRALYGRLYGDRPIVGRDGQLV